ncbi:uncharacterized protein LOC125714596 [Brienomyrus brachyistius]|uniref:uncharacterized protein LOC125714596 n=1 Tax=Brienomyrus brachyistius TaxID=42636 RepID=UPI0020B1815B|nr:uncharacterized protein LOC125714596 [Brienomyrus brachyistius]
MDNRKDIQNLFEHIKLISEEAERIQSGAVPYGPDILASTRENLSKLLPGERNFQVRSHITGLIDAFLQEQSRRSVDSVPADAMKAVPHGPDIPTSAKEDLPGARVYQVQKHIMGLINVFLQEQAEQSMDSSPADVMNHAPEVLQSNDDPTNVDMKENPMAAQNDKWPNINNEVELPRNGTDPADLMVLCEGHAPEVLQSSVDPTNVDMKEMPMAAQDGKRPDITNEVELPRNGTDPVGHAPEVLQSNVDPTNVDMKETPMAAQDGKRPDITHEAELPRNGTDPAAEKDGQLAGETRHSTCLPRCAASNWAPSAAMQQMTPQHHTSASEHSTDPSGGHASEVLRYNTDPTNVDMKEKPMADQDDKKPNITTDSHAPEVLQSSVDPTNVDMKETPMAAQDGKRPDITNEVEFPRNGTDPADEERELHQRVFVPVMEHSTVLSGDLMVLCEGHAPEVLQSNVDPTNVGMKENLMAALNGKRPNVTNGVKVHMLVAGETFRAHETFIQKLNLQIIPCSAENSSVILVFCPVVSRIGTDMEAAMARVTVNKPVILVFMHHFHRPSHMTNITVPPSRGNIVQVVHCAYHENKGLLQCQENEQAVRAVRSALLRYVDLHDDVPQPKFPRNQPVMVQQQMAAQGTNRAKITNDNVKVHMLVVGETFHFHETFIQKLKLQIELCSAEKSDVILVFCTVVSRIEKDMEAAMARVTEDKPVILVFMHHCHNPSHMTDITVQPSRSNIVQVVHCAFHESIGLLQCQENEQAVKGMRSALLRFCSRVDVQAEIPLTQSETEQQPVAARNANKSIITNEVPRTSTKPMTEERESGQGMIVPAKGHSTAPSGGTSLWSKTGRFSFSKRNWNISSVKVHMLVAGETFNTHETFIQKLKLQMELCSAESSSVILVFCPVVSQIGRDMEAAMARVTEDKPVILVFMHHCHKPSHMTDITVQPSRSNIVQVVHCAFHESIGLLQCQENEQAVKGVRSALLRFCSSVDVQAEIPLTQSETEQQPVAARNANRSIIANEVPRTCTKPMTEERESGQGMIVPAKGHSTAPSGGTSLWSKTERFFSKPNWNISSVKVHMLVAGETFNTHETFIQKLKLQIELCSAESSNVILVFCPVVSRIGTDMEAAMARVTGKKSVILVFMHHCHKPSHMTDITVQPSRGNIVQVVHCSFHVSKGLLKCQANEQAVSAVRTALLSEERTELDGEESESDGWVVIQSEHSTAPPGGTSLFSVIQDLFLLMSKWNFIYPSKLLSAVVSWLYPNTSVKAHKLVAGETFNTHETFIQKLNLQIQLCSAENSDVILVFCPVASRIGTDMEAAMARVTANKPVILVFMHHCHNPSHMTNITVQPRRSNIVEVVHCAFHQYKGLLECQENEQAVAEVYLTLLRYVDSHAEVSQSKSESEIRRELIAAQDDITHDNEPQSTEPVGERSESHQCKDEMEMEDSGGSSGGHAPEVLQSHVDPTNMDMKEKPMAAQDGKRPNITTDSELPRKDIDPADEERELHQRVFVPALEHSTGLSRGHTPEVLQSNVDPTNVDMKEKSMADQDGKCPRKRPSGENSACPSSGVPTNPKKINCASSLKIHVLVAGETFQAHETFIQKLNLQIELCSAESSSVILLFCPVVSRIGTDMDAAMDRVTGTSAVSSPAVHSQSMSSSKKMIYSSFGKMSLYFIGFLSVTFHLYFLFHLSSPEKVHMLVVGETFNTHETFIQKLNLQIELCSAENSDVILVFCTVVSRIGTDMEAAMARVTEDKPVILVFMHHCHNPSHMTNITVQPSRGNIVQVVHCAYHESKGLLQCQENEQAVKAVSSALLRYVNSHAEVSQSKSYLEIKQQLMAAQDDITSDSEPQSTEPVGERSKSHQCKDVTKMEDSGGSSGGHALEVLQSNVDPTNMDMEKKLMAAQDGKRPNITNEVELPRKDIDPAGEERDLHQRVFVPALEHSTGPSGENSACPSSGVPTNPKKINCASSLKIHVLVAGEMFQAHETFIQNLKLQMELCSAESSNVILLFCPVVSQIGTDMDAAMDRVTEDKPVILVFMHHCHDPSHMTNITVQPSRSNMQIIHCAYHEIKGLMECQENEQAVKAVWSALLRYVDSHDDVPQPEVSRHQPAMVQQQMAAQGTNSPNVTNDSKFPVEGTDPASKESESHHRIIVPPMGHSTGSVKVHMLVAGETFNTHETFIQKLNLQIELCSAESSSVILVFCPVVSQIETNMEATMARVTEDKPVILVFMHHCHDPSHMTNITVQPSMSSVVQVVHCAFHQSRGLLQCQENEQAVDKVHSALLMYKFRNRHSTEYVDSHAGVSQSKVPPTQSEMEQQQKATHDVNRSMITDGSRLQSKGHKLVSGKSDQRKVTSGGVKVHVLVTGETFQTHDTFMQKLKSKINPCSAESSNVILVFCPVVSRIGTDMEAAMARVTEDKPVILVFMHHCHNPSHITNITVQPSRGNIVQVVHCAYHQSKGLLQCQENKEAVDKVHSALLRNLHAEVPQSKVLLMTSDMEKQPMVAQDADKPISTSDGEHHRKGTEPMDLINLSEGDVLEVLHSNVDPTNVDMKEKLMAAQDDKKPSITNEGELPRKDIDPADEERELHQRVFVPALEHSTGPSGGLPPEVLQSNVDPTNVDMKEKPMADQDGKKPSFTTDSELPRKDIYHAGLPPEVLQSNVDPTNVDMKEKPMADQDGKKPSFTTDSELPRKDIYHAGLPPEVLQSNVDPTNVDMKEKPMADQDGKKPSITNDSELPRKDIDPADEERELHQRVFVPALEHSTGPSGDLMVLWEGHTLEVLQSNVDPTNVDMKEKMAAQDDKKPSITTDSELPRKDIDPADEERELHQRVFVPVMEHSTVLSRGLPPEVLQSNVDPTNVDMKEKPMADQDGKKPSITTDSLPPEVLQSNVDPTNMDMKEKMAAQDGKKPSITTDSLPPEVLQSNVDPTNVDMKEKPMADQDGKKPSITTDSLAPEVLQSNVDPTNVDMKEKPMADQDGKKPSITTDSLPPEVLQSNVDPTNVDMKEKMTDQDDKKPSITTDSELPRKDIDPADEERELHQRVFVPVMEHSTGPSGGHAPEVLQSNVDPTNMDMKEKMAAQDGKKPSITNDSELPRKEDPADEERELHQRVFVPALEHSTGLSGGHAPEVLQSNVDPTNVDMKEKMSVQDGKKPSITNDSLEQKLVAAKDAKRPHKSSKKVKVHMLVTGEIFNTHETFIEKLKLRIKLCSVENSNVILLFCPVVSHVKTDMEAAMARVTEDKPVILVFMHHCHSPNHMTNITVQPSRGNILQVVHCAFHETKGLMECQENEQAVKAVRSALLRYK